MEFLYGMALGMGVTTIIATIIMICEKERKA